MPSRETLINVEFITDDDCGMYRIGEIDTLGHEAVENHIDRFGEFGYEQLRDFAINLLTKTELQIRTHRLRNQQVGCANEQTKEQK